MGIILQFLGTVVAVYLTVNLVPGIAVAGGWVTMLIIAAVWSVITLVIKPVLHVLALPLTVLTLGLFAFILNAALFWAMEIVVPGFDVAGFVPALFGSIVLSIITWLLQKVF